jgi:hypothetical protein
MHGGALLKAFKILSVVAVVLFASSIVRADGVDARVNVNPGPDPILPSCGSAQFFADSTGAFNVACDTTVITSTITFGALDSTTNGGLSCASNLTSLFTGPMSKFNWTASAGTLPGGVDTCTFTAPKMPEFISDINSFLSQFGSFDKENDCDTDDFVFGIAKGCSIGFTTNSSNPNQPPLLFTPFAAGDVSVNGAPLLPIPEPSSIGLLAIGFVALFFGRRLKNGSTAEMVS